MLSKKNNASIAVIASDIDVHLFFECVFEEDFDLKMFLDARLTSIIEKKNDYDYVVLDVANALREIENGCWNLFCKTFKNRALLLISSEDVCFSDKDFGPEIKSISYPFTKKDFYMCLSDSREFSGPSIQPNDNCKIQICEPNLAKIPQFARLLGSSEKINEVRKKILMAADTNLPLLFLGESGTGKTMAAKIAHELSLRKDRPFVIANMANARSELIETALFGSVRGAYTDARNREGLFKKADGGTLFMDEIAELSLECQAKLLRVIECGAFRPVGSDDEIESDVRLIFATNADLGSLVRRRLFREDLYWRIVDFPILVPALRERLEDFPLLIESELNEIKKKAGKSFSITNEAVQKMSSFDWPGNFRQFKSCLRRAALLSRDTCMIDQESISF